MNVEVYRYMIVLAITFRTFVYKIILGEHFFLFLLFIYLKMREKEEEAMEENRGEQAEVEKERERNGNERKQGNKYAVAGFKSGWKIEMPGLHIQPGELIKVSWWFWLSVEQGITGLESAKTGWPSGSCSVKVLYQVLMRLHTGIQMIAFNALLQKYENLISENLRPYGQAIWGNILEQRGILGS